MGVTTVTLPTFHSDQVRAYHLREDARGGEWAQNAGGRKKVIRCGRRWGKTTYGGTWCADGAIKGMSTGWFAPDYKKLSEAYEEILTWLTPPVDRSRGQQPVVRRKSKTDGVIRLRGGGRIDFWTLEDEAAGRSRKYHRVVVDEGAFAKNKTMLSIWEKSIEPTLLDYQGRALVCSNTNGVDPENFMYAVCNDPRWGFIEHHAPSTSNPLLPLRKPGETEDEWRERRDAEFAVLKKRTHPLVYRQEYEAEFVDWSGVAFFALEKMLVGGLPVPFPVRCDSVFAVLDTATKTGTENDGTAVVYCARSRVVGHPLVVLDWDVVQIEGASLEEWLPSVMARGEELARECRARHGFLGAWIEDKASGEILLQQARKRRMRAHAIDSRLTALGKDERAISVSGYVFRGEVKLSEHAHDKVTVFKESSRNHLVSQVTGFRIGDKDAAKRADDALDAFVYSVAIGLGDSGGF